LANTWITDITHFLDGHGGLPEELPGPARNIANHLGRIVVAATVPRSPSGEPVQVRCRRRPGRRPCPGVIDHVIEPGGEERIFWRCTVCGDNGEIHGWKGSIWDCRGKGVLS